ncbi:helix-turn-helix domain-containing protein [uncultured Acetatifactor sp.]|uniref:helix-turn-helix domain-containing protein n=1 Tax=uncultured Acetatifactor sp. TaxID=1671927 RepID=UPI002630C86B|nr:helix-turn-helix domain-containing protein [uncultured Acetatifactor sp.]
MTNEELLILEDICPILHIGKTTAYRLIQSGQLPAQKIGGKWQVRPDDFKRYLAEKFHRS